MREPSSTRGLMLGQASCFPPPCEPASCDNEGPHAPLQAPPVRRPLVVGRCAMPVLMVTGDRDKMCPHAGARKQFALLGSPYKRLLVLGPESGHVRGGGALETLATWLWRAMCTWVVWRGSFWVNEGIPSMTQACWDQLTP